MRGPNTWDKRRKKDETVLSGMHPFSLVDNEHFITLVKELDPRINLSCRTTLTNVLLPKLYEEAKTKLREELASVNHVALTTDGWTSNTGDSYITVTVHYINSHLKMITRVLNTSFVPQAHTSENICAFLKEVDYFKVRSSDALELHCYYVKKYC